MTLSEAITLRMRQAALCGWRLSRRREIAVTAGRSILTLGWVDGRGICPAEPGQVQAGDVTISVDLADMPAGVDALAYDALPDTRDLIDTPTEAEIIRAAAAIGCRYVDRGEGGDRVIYWMVK